MLLHQIIEAESEGRQVPRPGKRPAIVSISQPRRTALGDGSMELRGVINAGFENGVLDVTTLRVPARLVVELTDPGCDVLCRARLDPTDPTVGIVTSVIGDHALMDASPHYRDGM